MGGGMGQVVRGGGGSKASGMAELVQGGTGNTM